MAAARNRDRVHSKLVATVVNQGNKTCSFLMQLKIQILLSSNLVALKTSHDRQL